MQIQTAAVAFRCPACGCDVLGEVNLFDLGGEGCAISCECGQSHLRMLLRSDGKIHISVPCLFCPEDHTYRLSGISFLERGLFTLSCKYTAMDIAFMGDHAKVLDALAKSEEKLVEIFSQFVEEEEEEDGMWEDDCDEECHCAHDHGKEKTGNATEIPQPTGDLIGACANPAVAMNLIYLVKEFAADGKISCECGAKQYNLQIGYDHIRLTCPVCGGEYRISTLTENDQFTVAEQSALCIRRNQDET